MIIDHIHSFLYKPNLTETDGYKIMRFVIPVVFYNNCVTVCIIV